MSDRLRKLWELSSHTLFRRILTRLHVLRSNRWRSRAFGERDLRPVPDGYRTGPPDFVGIASGRSGTTWWYQLLLEHPSIKPNRLNEKELSFFFHFAVDNMTPAHATTYRQAFAAPPGCLCGEWTPGYLCYPMAIQRLAETAPETKLLAIVRNPIDRFFSAINHRKHIPDRDFGLRGTRAYRYRTFAVFHVVIAQSLYGSALRHVLRRFDRSRLLVLQYEHCVREPSTHIARTYRFLGLDDSFVPPSLNKRINALPYSEEPDTTARAALADYFRDDVATLYELFPELDQSLWPDFL